MTTASLTGMTLLALAASALAILRLRRPDTTAALRRTQMSLTGLCIVGTALLLIYRTIFVTEGWQPLGAHVDGLLLIASLFAATVLFVQRASMRGLEAFALPLLTVLLAWGICASVWTYRPFSTRSMWMTVHMLGVYGGSLFFCIAAATGGMYLYVQRGLKKRQLDTVTAPLEAIETLNIRTATVGFALLSIGLVTGLIIVSSEQTHDWSWYSTKMALSFSVWLIYALVMNVRYATAFRGARAAWLSIVGLVLLIATFGAVKSLPEASGRNALVSWAPPAEDDRGADR